MDLEFVRRAERVTSFNLNANDFTTLKFKKEIQHLFHKHFFPNFDLSKTGRGINMNAINRLIDTLRSENREMLGKLHAYPLKGVGPGEATIFFLVDDAHLGGGSSAGLDIVTSTKGYEVKAVSVGRDGYATNFKLGGTFQIADLVKRAQDLKAAAGLGSGSEVNGGNIEDIKKKFPLEWAKLEEDFAERAYQNYFKNHEIIFIYNTGPKLGNIAAVKQVKKSDIVFERVTSGTIKPKVKL